MLIVSGLSGPARTPSKFLNDDVTSTLIFFPMRIASAEIGMPNEIDQLESTQQQNQSIRLSRHKTQRTIPSQNAHTNTNNNRTQKLKCKTCETCAMNSVTSKHILTNESQHITIVLFISIALNDKQKIIESKMVRFAVFQRICSYTYGCCLLVPFFSSSPHLLQKNLNSVDRSASD